MPAYYYDKIFDEIRPEVERIEIETDAMNWLSKAECEYKKCQCIRGSTAVFFVGCRCQCHRNEDEDYLVMMKKSRWWKNPN